MVFAIVCVNEERRSDVFHLLNDLRNLDYSCFLLTNLELNLENFQFYNVNVIKTETTFYHDFLRYELILNIFEHTNDSEIYYLDCDSRFFDFRGEKFDKEKFHNTIKNMNFEILTANFNTSIKYFFEKPKPDENKDVRQFSYGYNSLIQYLKIYHPSFENLMDIPDCWEGHLIFRKTDKVMSFLRNMIEIGEILIREDIINKRKEIACSSAAMISLLCETMSLDIKKHDITHHFFKANFLKELFPYNQKINVNEKIFTNNNIL